MDHGFQGLLAMAPPADGQSTSIMPQLILFGLIFAIFYFVLIAPARRKQKKHGELLNNLKPGDKVITSGGLHGTVVGVSESIVQLRVAEQVKVDVAKHAIADVRQPEE